MRREPKVKYCGLTVILGKPSRFDKVNPARPNSDFLLSATGGTMFNTWCLNPEINILQCDVRDIDCTDPLLPDTKCLMLLGTEALHKYAYGVEKRTLNEMRGSLLKTNLGPPAIASFPPQEAADMKNYEGGSANYTGEDDEDDDTDVKSHGATKRANYGFWLRADTRKVKQILAGTFKVEKEPTYKIYPSSDDVCNVLSNTSGMIMDFDIETDYEEQNLLCFAFTFTGEIVYSVPVLNTSYKWAYSALPQIMRSLAMAFQNNTVCAHNGAAFDFPVMALKYKIAVKKAMDTMIMMNRHFPSMEKSLMHCVSLLTGQNFHKDEDSEAYFTTAHMMDKLKYCGKDVFTLRLIRLAMEARAKRIPGLTESMEAANRSIIPYVTTMLQGIKYDSRINEKIIEENSVKMNNYDRIIKILIGEEGMQEVTQGKKVGMFAGSPQQCVRYFHDIMDYPVIWRSPDTKQPALGKKQLYKLAIKVPDNPIIKFVLLYRKLQKENGALKFIPWKDDSGRVAPLVHKEEQGDMGVMAQAMVAHYSKG